MLEIELHGNRIRISDGGRCESISAGAKATAAALNSLIDANGGVRSYLPGEDIRVFNKIIKPAFPSAAVVTHRLPKRPHR